MYKVIKAFTDLQQHHAYIVGDIFPHNGVEIEPKRLAELLTEKNRLGVPLIVKINEKTKRARKKKET